MKHPLPPSAHCHSAQGARQRQRGISLLESMIALVVSVLGIMGILGMQMRTLADSQTATRRAQAVRLIEDFSERMRVHPNALASLGGYIDLLNEGVISDFDDKPDTDGCTKDEGPCTPAALFVRDLGVWKQNVDDTLPLGEASIFVAPWDAGNSAATQIGIMVRWRENERTNDQGERDEDYMSALDAVTASGGANVACNDPNDTIRYTCHLQYITVAARCVRNKDDSKIYCPGSQS